MRDSHMGWECRRSVVYRVDMEQKILYQFSKKGKTAKSFAYYRKYFCGFLEIYDDNAFRTGC